MEKSNVRFVRWLWFIMTYPLFLSIGLGAILTCISLWLLDVVFNFIAFEILLLVGVTTLCYGYLIRNLTNLQIA
jgi:hypothetical protein